VLHGLHTVQVTPPSFVPCTLATNHVLRITPTLSLPWPSTTYYRSHLRSPYPDSGHQPRTAGAAGSRRWTALARWRLRELNELPHYCNQRLDAAHAPACHYCAQVYERTPHCCLFMPMLLCAGQWVMALLIKGQIEYHLLCL
jgi:hypothetical protein